MHTANLWTRWSTLTECVKAGTSVTRDEREELGSDWTQAFMAAMDRIARERAPLVVQAVGPGRFRRMLDVGGGPAALSIAFCRANPSLEAEVFDRPSVIPIARGHIETAGLLPRIRTRAGDLLRDDLGTGFDLVLVSQVCHSLSEVENLDLLKKCHAALTPGGTLVIQEFILDSDKTSPKWSALFALNMLVGTRGGGTYSEEEFTDWLRATRFEDVRRVRLPGPSGLIISVRGQA
jgi:SAM-dependent methyltransferase